MTMTFEQHLVNRLELLKALDELVSKPITRHKENVTQPKTQNPPKK